MKLAWYLHRLRKMTTAEIGKRLVEQAATLASRIRYRDPQNWPYRRFAPAGVSLKLHPLPALQGGCDCRRYRIYNFEFDVTRPIDTLFSGQPGRRWPDIHSSMINYRPGNPYGDVRINWELNRLQFLPHVALADPARAVAILADWLDNNRYCHGPAYLSAMEVAIRWISIYRTLCGLRPPVDPSLLREVTGLAVASGLFISGHLSTHSSAGNHLIVEATGLFWLGKALERWGRSREWIGLGRRIMAEQIERQINPDGSGKEQSFWYLGFVLDAVCHYLLLEDKEHLDQATLQRIEQSFKFVQEMTLPDGTFPDFGDRDDGYIFRCNERYEPSPFPALLQGAATYCRTTQWQQSTGAERDVKVFPDGGMTLLRRGKGRLLFRQAPLGLPATYGHGHADALSIILFWNCIPVLIDPGSGQYSGDQRIRDYFRSTKAHNTVEVAGTSQANMLGPFLWEKSYNVSLSLAEKEPHPSVQARHDGYQQRFGVVHARKIEWPADDTIVITDSLTGGLGFAMKGAFHFGDCRDCTCSDNTVTADFGAFTVSLRFPGGFAVSVTRGSEEPFLGWRSSVYGAWLPVHAVSFSRVLTGDLVYSIILNVDSK